MSAELNEFPENRVEPEHLFERLADGLCLVTANHRLARILHVLYIQWRSGRGDLGWPQPNILAWDHWIERLWDCTALGQASEGGAVPAHHQLQALWLGVLGDDDLAGRQLRPESLATALMQTRTLLTEWGVDIDHIAWHGDEQENHAAFRRWMRAFDARCRRDGWLAPEDRTPRLAEAVRDGRLPAAGPVGLLGFDELNPAQAELIGSLAAAGTPVSRLAFPAADGKALLWRASDSRDELHRMARWVRYWFEREPDSRIAVVVPDLEQRQDEIERQLREVLLPGPNAVDNMDPPWNVSLGRPLTRAPMVATALRLLRLARLRVGIADVGDILRSPFVGGAGEEWSRRALLERLLRDRYPKSFALRELVYRAGERNRFAPDGQELPESERDERPWHCPAIHRCARELLRFERESRGRQQPSDWAKAFDSLLALVGWPRAGREGEESGQPRVDSDDWPTWRAWQEAL